MQVVIVGIGKVGSTVAGYLAAEGHEVTIVDKNPAVVERIDDGARLVVRTQDGLLVTLGSGEARLAARGEGAV